MSRAMVYIIRYEGSELAGPEGDMIRAKLHAYRGSMVLALCDSELVGMTLDNNGVPFRITESFYGGPIMDRDDLVRLIYQVGNINVVGARSMDLLNDLGLIIEGGTMLIGGIPHAQIYRVEEK